MLDFPLLLIDRLNETWSVFFSYYVDRVYTLGVDLHVFYNNKMSAYINTKTENTGKWLIDIKHH